MLRAEEHDPYFFLTVSRKLTASFLMKKRTEKVYTGGCQDMKKRRFQLDASPFARKEEEKKNEKYMEMYKERIWRIGYG